MSETAQPHSTEADLIAELSRASAARMNDMLAEAPREARPAPRNPYLESLKQLPDPP